MKYLNAKEVLPPELLAELRRRRTLKGCYVYFPADEKNRNHERDAEIWRLHQEGRSVEKIARRFYLSPRRVRQILEASGKEPKLKSSPKQVAEGVGDEAKKE